MFERFRSISMFSRMREQLGTAGLIVSIVALVFAMVGGAYAAKGALTGKQKKEVKKIAKKFAGKQGKQGPAGPGGPAGLAGPAGPAGAKGDKGDAGGPGPAGSAGATGEEGATGATGATGEEGATGATGTFGPLPLPSGETLTGSWGGNVAAFGIGFTAISFPIEVEGGLAGSNVHFEEEETAECPGTLSNPDAAEGHLCVYRLSELQPSIVGVFRQDELNEEGEGVPGASPSGAVVQIAGTSGFFAFGTWAVTAP